MTGTLRANSTQKNEFHELTECTTLKKKSVCLKNNVKHLFSVI